MSVDMTRWFARRTARMTSWTTFSEDPDLISLAGGLPDTSLFGADNHAALLTAMAHRQSALALQYTPTRGMRALRECILEVMAAEATPVDPHRVIVTTGGQQALDLLCRVFLDPGDVVVTEAPTYPGILLPLAAHEAEVVQVDTDDDGMRMDALEAALGELQAAGRPVKFIYTVPTFQNPSGKTLSLARRKRLLEIARAFDLPVIEDNPYALLRFEGDPLPTLLSLDEDGRVLYVGTFSKILAPGLRVGWLVAPESVLDKVDLGKQCADLCTASASQLFIAEFFERGDWRGYVQAQVDLYRARRDAMLALLPQTLPAGSRWTRPAGGLFVWVDLPEGMDSDLLYEYALRRSVSIVPGRVGFARPKPTHHDFRLNFSACDEGRIETGLERIALAIRDIEHLGV